ncbi:Lysozyme [Halotydeus destructor]|nr:Lysozyme [Halotydeus destructor]
MKLTLALLIGPLIAVTCLISSTQSFGIPAGCFKCICNANGGCASRSCHGQGSSTYCGPYGISRAYWQEAGQPGPGYEECAKDKSCSEMTMLDYMVKNVRDCNKDGTVDCTDIAAVHHAGSYKCHESWVFRSQFMKTFNRTCTVDNDLVPETSIVSHGRAVSGLENVNAVRNRPTRPRGRGREPQPGRSPPNNYGWPIDRWPVIELSPRPRSSTRGPWVVDDRPATRRPAARPVASTARPRTRTSPRPVATPSTTRAPVVTSRTRPVNNPGRPSRRPSRRPRPSTRSPQSTTIASSTSAKPSFVPITPRWASSPRPNNYPNDRPIVFPNESRPRRTTVNSETATDTSNKGYTCQYHYHNYHHSKAHHDNHADNDHSEDNDDTKDNDHTEDNYHSAANHYHHNDHSKTDDNDDHSEAHYDQDNYDNHYFGHNDDQAHSEGSLQPHGNPFNGS